jgi:uncharacterized protein
LSGIPIDLRHRAAHPPLGNASASTEEADAVAVEIRKMLGGSWTNRDGATRPLVRNDFMVVAPYNAQVRRLRESLRPAGLADVPVGTVDKFQGREAQVVFYSIATSGAEDMPRTLEFPFSRNRLNVAVSRAMCLTFVVASPRLLESRARTIEQMRLINALCRFLEMAEAQGGRRPVTDVIVGRHRRWSGQLPRAPFGWGPPLSRASAA